MTRPFLELVAAAREAGLVLTRRDDQLIARGPRQHEQLVRSLLDRKPDVLVVLPAYTGRVTRLDWRRERILDDFQPCTLCRRPTLLIEPYDQRPCHKTCAEAAIGRGTAQEVSTTEGDSRGELPKFTARVNE